MPNLGLKITPENINYLYNINDFYSTHSFLTELFHADKFPIYRQVVLFDTNDDIEVLYDQSNQYILTAQYQFFGNSDLIPLLFDIPKSININNTSEFIYYYFDPESKSAVVKCNNNIYPNKQGLIVLTYLKNYTPPIQVIINETNTLYIINFTTLIDLYDLITLVRSFDIHHSDNLENSINFDILNDLNYYSFLDDNPRFFSFLSRRLKKITIEAYYTNSLDPSNLQLTLSNDEQDHNVLDGMSNIFLSTTRQFNDAYNAPINHPRILDEINTYEIDFTGWSSFLDEFPYINFNLFNTDVHNTYLKQIVLEYSNIDIISTPVDVIIDFTLYDTPNDLHDYIRTLPVYTNDRLDQVQYYGLIEYYKRWKFGLAQSSMNYLLSFNTTDLIAITQEFYFASNESEFEIFTSFDNKPIEEQPLIYVDVLSIKSYDPNKTLVNSIDITNRDNKLFSITHNLSNWSDFPKTNITFANYNGFIYNEYMHDGYWSKIILTYIH